MNDHFSYDQVPYPSYTFSQTHPDRLAIMAKFHGLDAADPEKCKVLELGCGDGTNLLWFASTLPESEFVGVDLSKPHINEARSGASELGLKNVSFYQQDIMEFTREKFGEFDYIVAHGLFSWVPDFVREKVLRIYSECLAPNGLGYISYNALPGCHIRRMTGDMMRFHADNFSDPMEKVRQSRAIVRFISEVAEKDSIYQKVLKSELETIGDRSDRSIYHDDLSEVNDPFYFLEFIGMIQPYGLQFLCEAKASSKHTYNITPEATEAFDSLGDDILRREQYLDFIVGRRFRSSIVCHANIKVDREQEYGVINNFFIASQLKPVSGDVSVTTVESQRFEAGDGTAIETNHPFTKAALVHLNKLGDEDVNFQDLVQASIELGGNTDPSVVEEDKARTAGFLLEMYKAGFVYLRCRRQPPIASAAGEFPEAYPFARWQVGRKCDAFRTLRGRNIKPQGNYVLDLLALLDGTRDRAALAVDMARLFERDGANREDYEKVLPASIDTVLSQFAASDLLMK